MNKQPYVSAENRILFDFQEFVKLGLKREVPALITPDMTKAVNLGAGFSHIPGAKSIDYPEWDASTGLLPTYRYYSGEASAWREETHPECTYLTAVFAFHFFEHLTGAQVISLLRDLQENMEEGATLNVVVPHISGTMAFHDLDHKSFWTADTFKTLFSTPYYAKNREEPWLFDIGFHGIFGIVERNMAVFTQLIRRAE